MIPSACRQTEVNGHMSSGTNVFEMSSVPETTGSSYPDELKYITDKRFVRRLTAPAGLTNFGVNLVRLPPGGQSSWRHAHSAQDEFVYMMEGELVLTTNAGDQTVTAGACIGFPAGTGDAHCFVNRSASDATFLVIGDRSAGDSVTYPDVDLKAELDDNGALRFTRKDGTPY